MFSSTKPSFFLTCQEKESALVMKMRIVN